MRQYVYLFAEWRGGRIASSQETPLCVQVSECDLADLCPWQHPFTIMLCTATRAISHIYREFAKPGAPPPPKKFQGCLFFQPKLQQPWSFTIKFAPSFFLRACKICVCNPPNWLVRTLNPGLGSPSSDQPLRRRSYITTVATSSRGIRKFSHTPRGDWC